MKHHWPKPILHPAAVLALALGLIGGALFAQITRAWPQDGQTSLTLEKRNENP